MKVNKLFFKECNLAGRKYHDVNEVWDKLKVGTIVKLERDLENHYDQNAIAVIFTDKTEDGNEDYLLGYIPARENEGLAQILEMGWGNIFECRISKINGEAHYENQIRLTIKVKRNSKQ